MFDAWVGVVSADGFEVDKEAADMSEEDAVEN